jgi:hypothetical protein
MGLDWVRCGFVVGSFGFVGPAANSVDSRIVGAVGMFAQPASVHRVHVRLRSWELGFGFRNLADLLILLILVFLLGGTGLICVGSRGRNPAKAQCFFQHSSILDPAAGKTPH